MNNGTEKNGGFVWLAQLLANSPQVATWLVLIIAASVIYTDNRAFINEQQEVLKSINKTQIEMQVDLREIHSRLDEIQRQINK